MSQNGCGLFDNHSLQGGESNGTADERMGNRHCQIGIHVVGMDDTGAVVLRKRIARSELLAFMASVPPLRIGMEACGSAHYWARCVREHGHDVRLIAPQFIKADVKSPKNDARNAEAIGEAVTRPTMRFVPITPVEPQDICRKVAFSRVWGSVSH